MRVIDAWVTGFVAVAVCATLALVYLATGTHWGIRQYAPLVQAVFSAAAIFAAFWLQERKRVADRNEAILDNTAAVAELFRSEEAWLARGLSFSDKPKVTASFAALMLASSENALAMLRQQKATLLPSPRASSAYVSVTGHVARICAQLDTALKDVDERNQVLMNWKQMEIAYGNVRVLRDIFMRETKLRPTPRRPPPAVADLKKWREELDEWENKTMRIPSQVPTPSP